jgi:hypothetical protein
MPIRVKFYGSYRAEPWLRQFPHGIPLWGNCQFIFDMDCRDYDWLVIYNDLPSSHPLEELCCPAKQTLLVTTEPSSIKAYGNDFTAQFGCVLTSQADWALPHRDRIFSQPALQWFYGMGQKRWLTYDEMSASPPLQKTEMFSTVCSNKQQRHTLHHQRYRFTQEIKKRVPELEIYGLGVRPIDDKAEALAPYRYHLVVENYFGEHHWTEKLADVFLGAALPFYCGCPNAADYFPAESFIPLPMGDIDASAAIIKAAMRNNEYEKRLPAILAARQLVLEKYNIFNVLSREIEKRHRAPGMAQAEGRICSIREIRKGAPLIVLRHLYEKCKLKLRHVDNFFK